MKFLQIGQVRLLTGFSRGDGFLAILLSVGTSGMSD
jgi:hypothetical protein